MVIYENAVVSPIYKNWKLLTHFYARSVWSKFYCSKCFFCSFRQVFELFLDFLIALQRSDIICKR